MIKAVIFDVDGVIVDSRDANVALFKTLLEKAGYPQPTKKAILKNFHLPLWQSLEILTNSSNQNEIKRIWDLAHDPAIRPTHLLKFPEKINEILEKLREDYKLAIVTSRIKVGLESVFMTSNVGHLFECVITFEDYKNPKPHPEPLLLAIKRLEIEPNEAIYVGDSHTDIEAAKAAGLKSIHYAHVKHHDADINVSSFADIVEAVAILDK